MNRTNFWRSQINSKINFYRNTSQNKLQVRKLLEATPIQIEKHAATLKMLLNIRYSQRSSDTTEREIAAKTHCFLVAPIK